MRTVKQPVIFVSHGAPDVLLSQSAALQAWDQLGAELPRPHAIAVVSAHWDTAETLISQAPQPKTIHDFGGFAPELYTMTYPAPGAPALAQQVHETLQAYGWSSRLDDNRGLDHGAWVPLMRLFPLADVPVFQIAISSRRQNPLFHYRLGQHLKGLTEQGVLVLASGAVTHNLGYFGSTEEHTPPLPFAAEFADWVHQQLLQGQTEALLNYRRTTPGGVKNHPTEDHIMPLFVAMGVGEGRTVRCWHRSFTWGFLAMDGYIWE